VSKVRATNRILGDHYDLEGRLRLRGTRGEIWIPPKVDEVAVSSGKTGAIHFPIGVHSRERVEASGDPVGLLRDSGWRLREHADGLVEDLVALAHDPQTSGVVRFAKKWGPVWKCWNPRHGECLWSKIWMAHSSRTRCVWSNVEPVDLFIAEARRFEAIVTASDKLRGGHPVPPDTWKQIAWDHFSDASNSKLPLSTQRWMLAAVIAQRLELLPGAPVLSVHVVKSGAIKLAVESGWGFIRAAWLQVAQLISGTKNLYICDNCGVAYERKREAKRGQHHFCPTCGAGGKGSKRLWWQEKGNGTRYRRTIGNQKHQREARSR
jgi:hypothetical protein